jgi:multidrug efflux pump subunit AcrB
MKLPAQAIRYHHFTLVVVALAFVFGILSFLTMPRSEDPQMAPRGATVLVLYPGASPADMEELVVDPVEEKLNELDDIKRINSLSGNGLASIGIEFLSGTDMDDTFSKITQKVAAIRDQLPKEIMRLDLTRWNMSDFVVVMQLALVSETESFARLEDELDLLETKLRRIPGVKRVKKWAVPEREISVSLDLERLAEFNIPLKQVIGALQTSNVNIPGGAIDLGRKRFSIMTGGSYQSLEEIRNTIVQVLPTNPLYLRDVADIRFADRENEYLARVNGRRAVYLTVNQKEGTNVFTVMEAVKRELGDFAGKLPPSMKLQFVFDQSESVRHRLNTFFMNLLQGLLLVGFVILIGEGLRAAGVVMTVIPLSIFMGIGLIHLCGYGLEQMTISGLVIALGMLVDNAIVVTQNISRFIRNGHDKLTAAVNATGQIAWAIVSSTLTTVFAFLPLVMMRDETGEYIRSMPLIVIFTLLASLLIALTFTPYLSTLLLPSNGDRKPGRMQTALERWIELRYGPRLEKLLKRPGRIVLLAVAVFLMTLGLAPFIGVSYFPKAEKSQFVINVNLPQGSSLAATDQVAREVEEVLAEKSEIRTYAVNVGRGNPQIHFSVHGKEYDLAHAQIFVELNTRDLRKTAALIRDLRKQFSLFAGARIEVEEIELGPPVEAPVEFKILGEKMEVLNRLAKETEAIFRKTAGTVNVLNPQAEPATDLAIRINREKAGMSGVLLADINTTVRASIAGLAVSRFRSDEGREYDIVVRLPVEHKFTMADFDRIRVPTQSGAAIPLKQVATIELAASSREISHYNFERSAVVTADVLPGYNVEQVTREIEKKLEKLSWPIGYHFFVAGERESRSDSFGGMGRAMAIALMAIFALLVLQFQSFSQPFIVFAAIPLAVIGSILALFLFGYTFSFTAFIGLTTLFGIVVNNSIILVDYSNQLIRREGMPVQQAVVEAAKVRFVPILLTTSTTIFGLIPLATGGGSLFAPMSLVMIGGLATSTLLTLLVVPALYQLLTREKIQPAPELASISKSN